MAVAGGCALGVAVAAGFSATGGNGVWLPLGGAAFSSVDAGAAVPGCVLSGAAVSDAGAGGGETEGDATSGEGFAAAGDGAEVSVCAQAATVPIMATAPTKMMAVFFIL